MKTILRLKGPIPSALAPDDLGKYCVLYLLGLLPFIEIRGDILEFPLFDDFFSVVQDNTRNDLLSKNYPKPLANLIAFIISRIGLYVLSNRSFIQHLKARGIPSFGWVCNSDKWFEKGVRIGVSGIMTDFPSKLTRYFTSTGQSRG